MINMSASRPVSNLSTALASVQLGGHDRSESGEAYQHQQQTFEAEDELHNAHNTNFGSQKTAPPLDRIGHYRQNMPDSGITLFSHRSAPNGFKIAIILTELGFKFHTVYLDLQRQENKSPYYVELNPNARLPAIIDHDNKDVSVWESGAIVLYLCRLAGPQCSLYSDDLAEQAQIDSWIFFQATGLAPMIGQALHFRYFHSETIDSAVARYVAEVRRLYSVVEMRLAEKREQLIIEMDDNDTFILGTTPLSESKFFDEPVWLVGDHCTVADLSFVTWNHVVERIGVNLQDDFPEVYKWTRHMMRRPGVVRALSGLESSDE